MDGDRRQPLAEAAAAPVGDERHAVAARQQLAGQRLGGKQVAAGAAGGEQDQPAGAHSESPMPTRRRDKASSIPMAMASASTDEPP